MKKIFDFTNLSIKFFMFKHTVYAPTTENEHSPFVQDFWKVLNSFSQEVFLFKRRKSNLIYTLYLLV